MFKFKKDSAFKAVFIGLVFLINSQSFAAASSCSSFIGKANANKYKKVSLVEVQTLVNAKIDHFAEKLTLTEEDLKPSTMMPDKDYIFQSEDPFTNRVCRKAMTLTLVELQKAGYDMNDWASFLTVYPKSEQDAFMKAAELTSEAAYEKAMSETPFLKYMDGIDHAVVYSPKHNILIDLTYRQFLFGKVSDEKFKQLPLVFVGTLEDYRKLVEPLLGKAAVDRLLTSAEAEMFLISTEDPLKPTMLEFESGAKTVKDFNKFYEGDINEQDFRELLEEDEGPVDPSYEDFVIVDPEPIDIDVDLTVEPEIVVEGLDEITGDNGSESLIPVIILEED